MGLKKLSWNWKVHKLQVPLLVFMHTHALTHTHTHTETICSVNAAPALKTEVGGKEREKE